MTIHDILRTYICLQSYPRIKFIHLPIACILCTRQQVRHREKIISEPDTLKPQEVYCPVGVINSHYIIILL